MYSFIVNPNSRSGEGRNVWNRLRSIMESQGISYQYFLTEYVGHATVLARRISTAGTPEDPVTLVTVGGDGTIYEVLTGIIDLSSVVFGFIPVGSGNDFCRSMGLPFDPFEALRSILENRRTIFMDVPVLHADYPAFRYRIHLEYPGFPQRGLRRPRAGSHLLRVIRGHVRTLFINTAGLKANPPDYRQHVQLYPTDRSFLYRRMHRSG